MRKGFVILTLAIFLITSLGFILADNETELEDDAVFCTMDVKMCPDGSYVGRDPEHNCAFFPCSEENDEDDEDKLEEENETDDDDKLLGASCGTVTPGYNDECCQRKGYEAWDAEEFKCIGERSREKIRERLGESCGTVTPGYNDECCQRKGYEAWDAEDWECEEEIDEDECEEWNCTKWSECSSEGIRTRECVASGLNCTEDDEDENETEDQPKLTRYCYEEKKLRPNHGTIECPEECICSGSTIKCSFENGTRIMTVYAGNSGNVIVQVKNLNMSTNVTLYKGENGKVYGIFEDNETKEIKLPDEVIEKLKEKKQKRLQLQNESINLSEDGYYHVEMKKKARLFWLVPVREHVQAEVNAETGETVKIRNPWWGFLARDMREKGNYTETEE